MTASNRIHRANCSCGGMALLKCQISKKIPVYCSLTIEVTISNKKIKKIKDFNRIKIECFIFRKEYSINNIVYR